MALRITKTSLAKTPASSPDIDAASASDPDVPIVDGLMRSADRALTAGDYEAYRNLFGRAAGIKTSNRRYQARKLLVEHALARTTQLTQKQVTQLFTIVAAELITVLEDEPAEPILLNYAGVLLYELWALDAALQLFTAAERLAPEVPHLSGNISGARQRIRQRREKVVLHPELPVLTQRATALAKRAVPATGLRISLCMIVKDEEEMLPRSLAAAAPAVDEIIVVDTGSTDRTVEIAESFGATVIHREWTGSFSDARNASLEAATGDWFIYLDADEVLDSQDVEQLRSLAGCTWHEAFFLQERNYTGDQETGLSLQHSALRMFRNRPEYRFAGRLHEQIAQHLPAYLPERVRESTVRVEHYGYLGAVRDAKEKSKRNIELLLAQQLEAPTDAFFHYNLGSEYFAAGDKHAALERFERSWQMVEQNSSTLFEFVPSLVVRKVITLRHLGRIDEMLRFVEEGLRRFPGFTDLVYEQGVACAQEGRLQDAIGHLRHAIEMGDAPSRYTAILGAGTFLPRIALGTLYMSCGRVADALPELQWCIDNTPEFFGVVHPYVTALMRCGTAADDVVAKVEKALPELTATYRFMLGTALYEQNAPAQAELQFRLVLEKQPHSGPARAALVESLLYQRRYEHAAAEAALMPEEDPVAPIALRSELFARALAADIDGATEALARSDKVRIATSDRELFSAWIARLRGEDERPVSAASAPLTELMLESLLRVQDFENFEAVLGLWNATEIPARERRERIAQIYLRRGFLRSAAREWMAVCEQAPDGRALTGLAKVALANGQHDTARTFATQALQEDPSNKTAAGVLQTCGQLAAA